MQCGELFVQEVILVHPSVVSGLIALGLELGLGSVGAWVGMGVGGVSGRCGVQNDGVVLVVAVFGALSGDGVAPKGTGACRGDERIGACAQLGGHRRSRAKGVDRRR